MDAFSASRFLSLHFPALPTDRITRTGAAAPDRPLVTVERRDNRMAIAAANRAACDLGLLPGLALADARARVRDLDVVPHDPAADAACLDALADWCDRLTPLVARDGADGLLLDMTGALHLFGGEARVLAEVPERLARMGFTTVAALAGPPALARALATHGPGGSVPPGAEDAAAARLPVAALGTAARGLMPEPAVRDALAGLRLAGLKTVGDVAARPRAGLAARFGAGLVTALDRLRGHARMAVSPRRPVPECLAERHFAEPVTAEAAIFDTLGALAEDVCGLVEAAGEGAGRFEARFFRVDGHVRAVAVEVLPTRDAALVLRLFRHRLEALVPALDPGFGLDMIRLEASGRSRLDPVVRTLDNRDGGAREIGLLVDRLSARFGVEAVERPVFHDSHVPERAAGYAPARRVSETSPLPASRPPGEPPVRPLRLFPRPDPVEVMAEVPDGPPARFRWRRVMHEVVRAEGPERIAPEWWHEPDALTRDYFRVEDAEGRRFWLFRLGLYACETNNPRWFLHGVFA